MIDGCSASKKENAIFFSAGYHLVTCDAGAHYLERMSLENEGCMFCIWTMIATVGGQPTRA